MNRKFVPITILGVIFFAASLNAGDTAPEGQEEMTAADAERINHAPIDLEAPKIEVLVPKKGTRVNVGEQVEVKCSIKDAGGIKAVLAKFKGSDHSEILSLKKEIYSAFIAAPKTRGAYRLVISATDQSLNTSEKAVVLNVR